jgi:hypothetical protein
MEGGVCFGGTRRKPVGLERKGSPGKMRTSLHSLDEKEAISFLISFFLINFFSFFLRPVFLTNYLI